MTTLSEIKNVSMLEAYLANHNLVWPNELLKKVYLANQILIRSWNGHKRDLWKIKRVSNLALMIQVYNILPEWLKSQGIKMTLVSIDAERIPEEKEKVYKLYICDKGGKELALMALQEAYDNTCASDKENSKNRIDDLFKIGISAEKMCFFIPIDEGEKIFAFKVGSGYYTIES